MRYLFSFGSVLAAATSVAGQAPVATPAPQYLLDALELTAGTIQELELPAERQPFRFALRLGGATHQVELEPVDVRSADYQLLVDTGTELIPLPRSEPVTWRGRIVGQPESAVSARIVDGCLDGLLIGDTETWAIQSVHEIDPLRSRLHHLVYAAADRVEQDVECGVTGHVHVPPANRQPGGIEAIRVAEIAADADLEFYRFHNSRVSNVENAITGQLNSVDSIYRRDTEINYLLTRLIVRKSRRYSSTNMSTLLNQFATQWRTSHRSVQRDVAHLWTGKGPRSGVVGIAYLSAICSTNNGYGVSKAYYGSSVTNVGLVAHELGHNWAAGHCDSQSSCRIMCSRLGSCSGDLTRFAPTSRNTIRNFRNSRTCLSDPVTAPTLSTRNPMRVEAFEPAEVRMTGTLMDVVTSINVGTQTTTAINTQTSTTLRFNPPEPSQLGSVPLSVTNAAGTSNELQLIYTATDPARVAVAAEWTSGQPLAFTFGGDPDDDYLLLLAFDAQTFPFGGFDVLTNHVVFAQGQLGSTGLGRFDLPIPARQLAGVQIWTQLVAIDELTAQVNDVTPPFVTTFF